MQPTDPKLNIVIGAKLAATASDLQAQLDELTKGLEAKVSSISFDDRSLQVLNEFVSSFKELTSLIEQNQRAITSVSDSASRMGTSLVDAARQAQQQFEGVNAQLSGTLQKIISLQDAAGKVFQQTFVVSERYGQQARQTVTYNDDGSIQKTPIQVTVDSASEEKAKAEIERWATQMKATIQNSLALGNINNSEFNKMEQSINSVLSMIEKGGTLTNDWRDKIAQVNTQWKIMLDETKTIQQMLANEDKFNYMQQSLQNRLDNIRQLPFVNQDVIDKLQSGVNGLTQDSSIYDVKRVTDMFNAVEQANGQLEADLKATQTEEAKTAQQMAQEVIRAEQEKIQAFKEELTQIKLNNQLEIEDATTSFGKARDLILQHTELLRQNVQLRKQALSDLYSYEQQVYAEEEKQNSKTDNHPLSRFKFAPTEVAKATIWYGMHDAMQSVASDFVNIQQGAAGLQQVFGETIRSQSDLNNAANQFIDIAQRYGVSINDVLDAAKLWGRQYKDLQTAIELTNASTLLSVVDNVQVADANRAVESSMNAMGMAVHNAGQAYESSMKLVDSWSAVAHGASVSAQDLIDGFERSAAAAHDAGLTVDQLNALVAAGVRNTGRSGAVIGNMWKSIIANITSDSPKVQEALKALNIDTEGKTTWQILLQIADASKKATVEQSKYFEVLSGGKYQYDTMRAALANTQTILDAYNVSLHSHGQAAELAQAQLHTFGAELQRLHDTIQKGVFDSSNGGLVSGLKDIVVWTNDLIIGLQKLPSSITLVMAGIVGLVAAAKGFISANQLIRDFKTEFDSAWNSIKQAYNRYQNGVVVNPQSATAKVASQIGDTTSTASQVAEKAATDATTASIERQNAALNQNAAAQARVNAEKQSGVTTDAELAAANSAVTRSAEGETEVLTGLRAALYGLDLAGGVLTLAIGGIIAALTAWAIHTGDVAQKQDELKQKMQQMNDVAANSLQNNGDAVRALVDEYKQLDQQTAHGTVGSTELLQKYYDVSQQLGSYLPQLTAYVDQQGRTHLKTAQAVEQEYQNLLKLNNLDNQGVLKSTAQNFDKLLKEAQDYGNQMDKLEKQMGNVNADGTSSGSAYNQNVIWTKGVEYEQTLHRSVQATQEFQSQIQDLGNKSQQVFSQMAQEATKAASALAEIKSHAQLGDGTQSFVSEISTILDFSKVTSDTQRVKVVQDLANVIQDVNKAEQEGKLTADVMNKALDTLAKDGVPMLAKNFKDLKQSIQDTENAQKQYVTTVDGANSEVQDVVTNNQLLVQAEKELSDQHRLSADTLAQLLDKYPDLIQKTGLQTDALKSYIETLAEKNAKQLQTDRNQEESIIKATQTTINQIEKQIEAYKQLAEAEQAAFNKTGVQGPSYQAVETLGKMNQAEQKLKDLQKQAQDAQNALAVYNAGIGDAVGSVYDAAGTTENLTKSTKDATSATNDQSNATDTLTQKLNDYKETIDAVNVAIDAQKAYVQSLDDTSSKYRQGLQQEIDLLQQKANLLTQEIKTGGATPVVSTTNGNVTITVTDPSKISGSGSSSSGGGGYYGEWSSYINAAAAKYGIPARLIAAIMKQESGGNAYAISSAGAIGLMQLMPSTAKYLGVNPYDPAQNIDGGARYLADLLREFGGNITKAVAAYNAGPGAVIKYGGVPPYSETQNYVRSVLAMYNGGNLSMGGTVFQVGSTGDVVKHIQEVVGVTIDGIFGSATKAAVERWQKAHGLTPDGIVGPKTLAAMGIKLDSSGNDIRSDINSAQQELVQTKQEIAQLNDQIVESNLKNMDNLVSNRNSNVIQRWQQIAQSYADGSKAQTEALKSVAYWQNNSEYWTEQQMKYIENALKNKNVTDAEKEKLKQQYEQLDTSLQSLRNDEANTYFQIATNQIKAQDQAVQNLDKQIQNLQKTLSNYPSISQEYQQAYAQEIALIQQKAQALVNEQKLINDNIINNTHLTAAQKEQLVEQSQQVVDTYGQLQDQVVQMKKDAANQIVQAEKDAIQQQMKLLDEAHQNTLKQLQDEKDAYDKLIDAKIKALQQDQSNQDYQEQLQKDQQDLQKLQNQYNALAMDNSEAGLAQKAQLAQQIADQQQKIADEQRKHQADLVQQSLEDQKQAYDDSIQAQQDAENTKYDQAKQTLQNILDDTAYWDNQITQIMEGNTKAVLSQLQGLITQVSSSYNSVTTSTENQASAVSQAMQGMASTIQSLMNTTGDSIQQNLIKQLQSAIQLMQQVNNIKLPSMPPTHSITGTGYNSVPEYNIETGKTTGGNYNQQVNEKGGQWINGHWYAGYYNAQGVFVTKDKLTPKLTNGDGEVRAPDGTLYIAKDYATAVNAAGGQWINHKWVKGHYVNGKFVKFDTGGYTGNLPPDGALAVLHSKELVLNQKDTQNILDAVKMIRQMGVNFTGSNNLLVQAIQNIARTVVPEVNTNSDNKAQTVTIHMPITIGSLTGDQKGVKDFFATVNQELKRKGVILK